jgi:hypothetical protein
VSEDRARTVEAEIRLALGPAVDARLAWGDRHEVSK